VLAREAALAKGGRNPLCLLQLQFLLDRRKANVILCVLYTASLGTQPRGKPLTQTAKREKV
jgi:hypothetical protein